MYRLEIVAGRRGIDADHIAWRMFRLTPCSQTPLTTTYVTKLPKPLDESSSQLSGKYLSQIMQGWIEEGDIIGFVCEVVDE